MTSRLQEEQSEQPLVSARQEKLRRSEKLSFLPLACNNLLDAPFIGYHDCYKLFRALRQNHRQP
ncbi:hypothetical protein E2320_013174 [Naja naja]|nr:hypothetical protein E2320_013174 [Naja naja]